MKKFFALIAAALLIVSCGSDSKNESEPLPSGITEYKGNMVVTFRGEDYTTENVVISFKYNKDTGKADILFNQVKFVPQMPVTLDIVVPGAAVTRIGDLYAITGDGIEPTSGGVPYEEYLVTNLIGQWDGSVLDISLLFGSYPTRFVGEIIKK